MPVPDSPPPSEGRPNRIPWAALLRRVFGIDALSCPKCKAQLVVLAFITDPRVVHKVLDHLGLPTAPPQVAPARLPVEVDLPFSYVHDDSELFDASYDGGPEPHGRPPP